MKSDLEKAVESDVKHVETALGQDVDLNRTLVPFDDWIQHRKIEHRSMVLGNILAAAIIVAAFLLVVITVLAR